jgi:hypothetical protein
LPSSLLEKQSSIEKLYWIEKKDIYPFSILRAQILHPRAHINNIQQRFVKAKYNDLQKYEQEEE